MSDDDDRDGPFSYAAWKALVGPSHVNMSVHMDAMAKALERLHQLMQTRIFRTPGVRILVPVPSWLEQ